MSKYLRDAEDCVERIEYFHVHAGKAGFAQAHYYELKLEELLGRAFKSKHNKSDIVGIQEIIRSIRPKMIEMKQREIEGAGDL